MRFAYCILLFLLSACSPTEYVKIYKYDGSRQCEPNTSIPLELMAQELTRVGINVHCSQKSTDGMMRIMMCGAATGSINIYQISETDLKKAVELGFKPVSGLTGFKDTPCQ
ncbi:MAG: hypothetical protein HUJ30_00015 [Gammaproteobacteria bacterium]|nr:hypothetical protein [Gammaproteobacteria bacterium]